MNHILEQNNYLHVPNFLTAQEANELAQAFFSAKNKGELVSDIQAPSSLGTYNLFPCVKTMIKKVSLVSELCGEDVLPTYVYGRIYNKGEVLVRHRDRAACEISLTINLQKDETDWPIWIQKPNGEEVSLNLNPGDAMMYLGCTADHWREAYQGNMQTQVFFHYVRANGPRAYNYFDIEVAARKRGYVKMYDFDIEFAQCHGKYVKTFNPEETL